MAEWDYHKLGSIMKRWSFESKMRYVEEYSQKLIDPSVTGNPNTLCDMILPEDLEAFTMIAVKNKEWKDQEIDRKEFIQAIQSIKSFIHPELKKRIGNQFGDWFLILANANQIDIRANPMYRIARYYYYFMYKDESIDMNTEFISKFGVAYKEISAPIIFMWWCLMKNGAYHFDDKSAVWFLNKYGGSLDYITQSRDQFVYLMDTITTNEDDYKYCFRLSYQYPLIINNGYRILTLPHLLIRSVTESMMHRLTENDDSLRNKIGKNVFESYLYKLICESNLFDETIQEKTYTVGKQKDQKTMDIMTRIGDTIICFDSKSFTPCISLRVFDEISYKNTIDRIAESVVQAYKHTYKKYGKEYDYLEVKVNENRSNIYGVVVLAENPFVPLQKVYHRAAEFLKIDVNSSEYTWMLGHVGWVGLDQLEEQMFQSNDFLSALKYNEENKAYNDHWMVRINNKKNDDHIPSIVKDAVRDQLSYVIDAMRKDNISILVNNSYLNKLDLKRKQ